MKTISCLTFIILASMMFISCGEQDIRLDVTPSVVIHYFDRPGSQVQTVDAGAYFDMEYTWKVGPHFKAPGKELRAFVHFRDNTGNIIVDSEGNTVQDDHDFSIPLSEWKPGEDVVYTRKRLKFNENLGSRNFMVNLYVGIYDPTNYDRAELNCPEGITGEDRDYLMATFRIRRNPKIYPRFNDTWHGPEPAPNEKHRWSKKESVVTFLRDPEAPAVELWMSGHSPIEDLPDSQQLLWLYMHEKKPEFLITKEPIVLSAERFELTQIPIPNELYETFTDRDIRIIFEVDKVLAPENSDERQELGFRVHELLLLPKNLQR